MKSWPIVLLLLLSTASALQVYGHDIQIRILENDSAYVEEIFRLKFETPEEKTDLKEIFAQQTIDTALLSQYGLNRAIVEEVSNENGQLPLGESDFADLRISYTTETLTELVEEKGKKQIREIPGNKFSFWDGTKFTFPYEIPTDLKILVPAKYPIKALQPEPHYSRTEEFEGEKYQEIDWNDKQPISSNTFYVRYEKEFTISSMFSIETIIREFQTKYLTNPVYIIVAVIIVIMIIWYRKELGMMITESFAGEPEHEDITPQDE